MTSRSNSGELLVASLADERDLILQSVDPELRSLAESLLVAYPPMSKDNLAQARAMEPPYQPADEKAPTVKRQIPGGEGHPDVTVYVVNAKAGSPRPAILHTHGGGFILGTAESVLGPLQEICLELDCMAVTVDYRLAPETTYAGSVEDNYAALKWLYDHAEELGADPARIALLGESAGAGHAALLAIAARDRGEIPVAYQCLAYPMLDDRTGTTRPVPPHMGRIVWSPESNRFGWESFLGMPPGGPDVPQDAVPARVTDLKGLPPTFIGVGSIDLFFDEDLDFAQRLRAASVPVELLVVPGAFHGFDILVPQARVARQFNAAKLDALRRGLGLAAESH